MADLLNAVGDYCSSTQFMFLDSDLKEHAEGLLHYWCGKVGGNVTNQKLESALKGAAKLDLPLEVRKSFPRLLEEFFEYLIEAGVYPDAEKWQEFIGLIKGEYLTSFRVDGSIKGETFKKNYTDVGRNDPCPCGSGKKFKKCCMGLMG